MTDWIWVFHGDGAMLNSAVFTELEKAEEWIKKHSLSGMLTKMPINQGIYDWAIETGTFVPKSLFQQTPTFIQKFTSAYLEHFHYESGKRRI
jgi:hypothetical protein